MPEASSFFPSEGRISKVPEQGFAIASRYRWQSNLCLGNGFRDVRSPA